MGTRSAGNQRWRYAGPVHWKRPAIVTIIGFNGSTLAHRSDGLVGSCHCLPADTNPQEQLRSWIRHVLKELISGEALCTWWHWLRTYGHDHVATSLDEWFERMCVGRIRMAVSFDFAS